MNTDDRLTVLPHTVHWKEVQSENPACSAVDGSGYVVGLVGRLLCTDTDVVTPLRRSMPADACPVAIV
jgi:hypothetical protein